MNTREAARYVAFAQRWLPFGGGPAETIMVEFGLSTLRFFQRLEAIMNDADLLVMLDNGVRLTNDDERRILTLCRDRIETDNEPFVSQ